MKSFAVIGGSIIGLATTEAILKDFPNVKVTVYSSEYSPNTTANVAAGFVEPHLYGVKENMNDIISWTNSTVNHMLDAAAEDEKLSTAIRPLSGYLLSKKSPLILPEFYEKCFLGLRKVENKEITKILNRSHEYTDGCFFTSWSCDCGVYLPFLMKRLSAKGVTFVTEKIHSFDKLAERGYDVVVNCAGFGAYELCGDEQLNPVKGQVLVVDAPWIKHFIVEEDGDSFVLPRNNVLIVGGTNSTVASLKVDKSDTKRIWSNACEFLPSLKSGIILQEKCGIRPVRSKIRMEAVSTVTRSGKKYVLFHHYGHGGAGVSMHWGSAETASAVLKKFLW